MNGRCDSKVLTDFHPDVKDGLLLQHFEPGEDVNIRYGEVLVLLEGKLKNTKGFTLVAPVGLAPDMSALLSGASSQTYFTLTL